MDLGTAKTTYLLLIHIPTFHCLECKLLGDRNVFIFPKVSSSLELLPIRQKAFSKK